MEGSRPTWMRHSVVHRWSYTGTTSQNLSESPRGIQVDSRAHWNYQMIYRTSIYVYVFSLAAKAVKNSRAVWENLLRRIGHLLLCKPGRCAHPHRVRDEPTVWGSTVVNLYLAKPLRSPNHRVHVSIVLWRIRLNMGDDDCAIWVAHQVGWSFYQLPDQTESTRRSSQLPFHCWESLPPTFCPFRQLWRKEQHGSLCPLCECVLIALRPCRLLPELDAFFCMAVFRLSVQIAMSFVSAWFTVWNAVLLPLSPEEQTALEKLWAAAFGRRQAEQLQWRRCSFIKTS